MYGEKSIIIVNRVPAETAAVSKRQNIAETAAVSERQNIAETAASRDVLILIHMLVLSISFRSDRMA